MNTRCVGAQVVWTQKSSLDIQITLWQRDDADPSLAALFSFVHLDPGGNNVLRT